MFGLIRKNSVIKLFAEELAQSQKIADYWFYVRDNQEMSSYLLNQASVIKALTIKFRIANEVYDEAYTIYDFRNSGKKNFVPNLDLLKEAYLK